MLKLIKKGTIKIITNESIKNKTKELLDIANNCFFARNKPLNLVHFAEMSAVAAFLLDGGDAVMIDERTTR